MIIDLNDSGECADIRSTLVSLLDKRADPGAVRRAIDSTMGFDQKLTGELAELGFTALALPESAGGLELGATECAVVWHELGRRLVPGPVGDTLVAGLVLGDADAEEVLSRLGEGATCALARQEPGSDRLRFVPHGDAVDLVLAVNADEVMLIEDVRARPTAALDPTRQLAEIDLSGGGTHRLGDAELAQRLDSVRLVAQAVEAAGAAVRALELTVAHLSVREQFGRPLGSFQALKHRCADLVVAIRGAYATAERAVVLVSEGNASELQTAATLARLVAADTLFEVAAEAIQLHGGIGITWEHDIQLYLKRAKSTQLLCRTQAELRDRLRVSAGLA
ncbi:acyl-CoA dehydrogenase [Enemella dayhoffiae]|uniref:Acyl-CoA dehydrogenase n=1 Tax=Enemella dayhoffiae TaxID=2016507 RepID=A0A255GL30_9ACTN|nr:acyl-CoA dehydrogenase family protein [Enemella dayhoffiae]OYO16537.1 acyl-CoA dehydrogenase [Enemella dayhoffiae]